ncbi:MAG: HPr(Ser) kinase/phosphatase [Ruthenibacterium sp.]
MAQFSVSLDKIVKQLNLEIVYTPCELKDIQIVTADVNRPGLLLTGYDEFFDPTRVQILGNAEMGYLRTLPESERRSHVHTLFATKPPAVVVTRSLDICDGILEFAEQYEVPIFRTAENTSVMMSSIISILSVELAERITRHGVLVEVYGEGILILGESGVGKSETAIELVKRGHRLIADDAVELRRVSNRTIVGTAPENIRHFIELRGVGIINVARVFGSGAVKMSEKIDLVVQLEQWNKTKNYSRTGLETDTIDILGIPLASTVIPVMPGRNLAVILEAAAINNRQKKMGYNAAQELMSKLGLDADIPQT